jgi:hypothetical protein
VRANPRRTMASRWRDAHERVYAVDQAGRWERLKGFGDGAYLVNELPGSPGLGALSSRSRTSHSTGPSAGRRRGRSDMRLTGYQQDPKRSWQRRVARVGKTYWPWRWMSPASARAIVASSVTIRSPILRPSSSIVPTPLLTGPQHQHQDLTLEVLGYVGFAEVGLLMHRDVVTSSFWSGNGGTPAPCWSRFLGPIDATGEAAKRLSCGLVPRAYGSSGRGDAAGLGGHAVIALGPLGAGDQLGETAAKPAPSAQVPLEGHMRPSLE